MNKINKVKPLNIQANVTNSIQQRTNNNTLYTKLQNINEDKLTEFIEIYNENQKQYEERQKNIEKINKIKEILENSKNNKSSLNDLQSLNELLSEIKNIKTDDLETLYNIFTNFTPSIDSPKNVLENNGITLEEFNNFIKKSINNNYSSSKGVILAGLALAEYSLLTGENFRYSVDYATRREINGIEENTYLDCSSFVFWALYNGGYNWPVIDKNKEDEYYTIIEEDNGESRDVSYNDGIINNNFELSAWAKINNLLHDPRQYDSNPGDYLLVNNKNTDNRHIMIVIEEENNNYYVLEERGNENGLILNKRSKEEIIEKGYKVVNMQPYYNNDNNKRKK